jgi:putative glutamine amidotransferase
VNSLHQQAISKVSPNLKKVAIDKDQIIQSVESRDGMAIIGVQWHPEYLWFIPSQFRLFRWLVEKARDSMALQKSE